jgi:predicted cupin superfamily sugar epimerase
MPDARYWIDRLQLKRHPEGGWFRETYRSSEKLARESLPERFNGDRSFATAIYYLLESNDFSALHRIHQDEGWHFYEGSPLTLHRIDPGGTYTNLTLGRNLDKGEEPQAVVLSGWWFAATVEQPNAYSLVGCTVAPGFDFADFELADREALRLLYPRHGGLIDRLTR